MLLALIVPGTPRRFASGSFFCHGSFSVLEILPPSKNVANGNFADCRASCVAVRPPFLSLTASSFTRQPRSLVSLMEQRNV
jgi:hypothetical protein